MSVTDEVIDASGSFWELGRYTRTVKRTDNGHILCNQLKKLIEERSEIEKKYSGALSDWAKRWNSYLDKGPEYGTNLGAWRGLLTEADHVADLHTGMGERLMFEVHGGIKVWQKENYHKSMMHFKETKDFEDNFRKAQKPWGKRLTKVIAAKKDYHTACKTEKSTANHENNARGDTNISQDQLKKLQDKLRKCQQEVEATREKYTATVNDLNGYNAKYIEDMTEVYSRCQDFEQKRIDFFKKTLFQLHACLDLSVEAKYSQIYTNLHTTIGNIDPSKDLKWWSNNNGVDMPMAWPMFEEYSPELKQISTRGKTGNVSSNDGIIVTAIKHNREDSYGNNGYSDPSPPPPSQPTPQPTPPPQQYQAQPSYSSQNSVNSYGAASVANSAVDSSDEVTPSKPRPAARMSIMVENYDTSLNPFGEEEEEEEEEETLKEEEKEDVEVEKSQQDDSPTIEHPNPFGGDSDGENLDEPEPEQETPPSEGWTVRALYDYNKAEDDELSFKEGDIFVQLTTEDDMGWCTGQKGGTKGLLPKAYVVRI